MRLTITLDDDLYAMARAHAVANKLSISKAIADLLRRRLETTTEPVAPGQGTESSYVDPVLGIRVSRCRGTLSAEDVRRAEEEDDGRGWNSPTAPKQNDPS